MIPILTAQERGRKSEIMSRRSCDELSFNIHYPIVQFPRATQSENTGFLR